MFRTARIACVVATLFIIALCGSVDGQEASEEDMKQANNPLASFTTFNFHNYFIPELDETDGTANTFWIRYAQPFRLFKGDWLLRASLKRTAISLKLIPSFCNS